MKKSLVIMAAGMGSRFGGLKQVSKFGKKGLSLLDYAIYDARKAGFEKVVFIIRKDIAELFKSSVSAKYESDMEVFYAYQELDSLPKGYLKSPQREKPWGTGHAVLCAKDFIKEPFLAINADDYYGAKSFEIAAKFMDGHLSKTQCALVSYFLKNTLSPTGGVSRGVCASDENGFLKDINERYDIKNIDGKIIDKDLNVFDCDTPVSMNFWCFDPSFMEILNEYFLDFLKENSKELKSEFYLPFAVDRALKEKRLRAKMLLSPEIWQGVTYAADKPLVEDFLQANRQDV